MTLPLSEISSTVGNLYSLQIVIFEQIQKKLRRFTFATSENKCITYEWVGAEHTTDPLYTKCPFAILNNR